MASLEDLYYTTETLIADRTRDLGSAIDAPPTAGDAAAGIGASAGAGVGAGVGDVKAQRAIQNLLKNQMAELAAAMCNNMEDKLRATSRYVYFVSQGKRREGRWLTSQKTY
jgi:nuclear pore complex protein Nup133